MLPGNAAPPEPDADLLGRIPCLVCSYDLRGLAPDTICPECTFPARISRAEARRLPAPYLRALSWSVWLTLAPVVVTLLGILSPIAEGVVAWFSRVNIGSLLFQNAPLSLIPWAVGVRCLATLRPPNAVEARSRIIDIFLTIVTAAFIVSILWLMYWSGPWGVTPTGRGDHPAWIPVIVCGQTLVTRHMRASVDLAACLASPRLHESARAVLVCSVPTSVLGLCAALDLQKALPNSLTVLELVCILTLAAGAIGCICGLLGVCVSTFGALNRLRTIRKNLIQDHTPASTTK